MAKKKAKKRPAAAKARPMKTAARRKARKAKPARRPARKAAAAVKKRPARAAAKKRTAAAVTTKRTAAAVVKKKKTAASSRKAIPQAALPPRHAPSLDRARKQLREIEENVPTPPSSLDLDRTPSAARSGRRARVSVAVAVVSSVSARLCIPATPSRRAAAPRARMADRAGSGGPASGPNSARLRTSPGTVTVR